jgi:hypothetical protein
MPRGGVTYNTAFERRLAAIELGFKTRAEWDALDIDEQAELIAIWRGRSLMRAAESWYESRKNNNGRARS